MDSERFIEFGEEDDSPRDPTPENELDNDHLKGPEVIIIDDLPMYGGTETQEEAEPTEPVSEAPGTPVATATPHPVLTTDDEDEEIGSPPPTIRDDDEEIGYYGSRGMELVSEVSENNNYQERPSLDRDYTQKTRDGGDAEVEGGDDWAKRHQGARGKVSDLISRFNQGGEAVKGSGNSYKQEYGASKSIGKIHQTKFR